MNRPDFEFWMNLANLQTLNGELAKTLKYNEISDVPMDLNDIPVNVKGKAEINAFKHFATKLEDQALDFKELAEEITVYTAQMEENFDERENELLQDEGIRTGALVGE